MAFAADYANWYDAIYADKDYDQECRYVDGLVQRFATGPARKLLDIGAGTGNHAIPLARMGYQVTGIDATPSMLALARKKAAAAGVKVEFVEGRGEQFELRSRFEVVTCMFNVLDYIVVGQPLTQVLARVHRHLVPGGLFIFDFRNAAPCLTSFSPVRKLTAELAGARMERTSTTNVDPAQSLMRTVYTCKISGPDGAREFEDEHVIRFLAPEEVRSSIGAAGFDLLAMGEFLDIDQPATDQTWNVMAAARAR